VQSLNSVQLSITLAHDEVERAEDRDDVAHHAAIHDPREDRKIDEAWAADLEAVRSAAAF
jgi:hypothetical protein